MVETWGDGFKDMAYRALDRLTRNSCLGNVGDSKSLCSCPSAEKTEETVLERFRSSHGSGSSMQYQRDRLVDGCIRLNTDSYSLRLRASQALESDDADRVSER